MPNDLGVRWSMLLALVALSISLSGCVEQSQSQANAISAQDRRTADIQVIGSDEPQPGLEEQLREIAGSYESYDRIDPQQLRWANEACAPPRDSALPDLEPSGGSADSPHGRKLYALFAKIASGNTYTEDGQPNPVGQVVVKESWIPELVVDRQRPLDAGSATQAKADLFIMFKLAPATPGTDEGWVYGTVKGDGKTVTAAGRLASCMSCHIEAPHDRLFGPDRPER
jgi:hypothetical protein